MNSKQSWACQGPGLSLSLTSLTVALWVDYIPIVPNEENGMVDWWAGPVPNG